VAASLSIVRMNLSPLPSSQTGHLQLKPSHLRPNCKAEERLFLWKGTNTPLPSTIDDPFIHYIEGLASRASLCDTSNYGSGLRKFHVFCDIFSVPELQRLPASFELIHSFALWVVTDPDSIDPIIASSVQLELILVTVACKYLAAIRAWHIAQGWPPPLSKDHLNHINWFLRGLENIHGAKRKRPLWPPITLVMLRALKATLDRNDPFDACIWAMASRAFWGMMRFGEVSVTSRRAYDGAKHLKHRDASPAQDLNGKPYIWLDLPSAKTARPGETQSVFMVNQGDVCPLEALRNLARVVPAGPDDPLFSWRDNKGEIFPMVKSKALSRINSILVAWDWGTTFGHSFRIAGASFFLAQGVNPKIIQLAGRWKSLAYETYIRAFEQIASKHLGDMAGTGGH
jgi:hypothetical protein